MMHDLIRRTDIVGKITSAEMQAQFREMSGREAYTAFIIALNDAPTIDAVPVTRCKDCSFWTYEGVGSSTLMRFGSCAKWYPFGNEQHSCCDDDFCSWGERRSDA